MILEHRFADVLTELHAVEALMANPLADVTQVMDRYDPDRRALVLAPVVTLGPIPTHMAGRRVQGADTHRSGGGWTTIAKAEQETHEHGLASADGGYRLAAPGEPADASLLIGPSTIGGFVRFTPVPTRHAAWVVDRACCGGSIRACR
jgi:hypothetical protein